ncbi:MAG: hypothetical protein IKA52_00020 [Bacteroidaceae bacterium]|nr:hypothetical protein [Bacteroidaceae bacterium]
MNARLIILLQAISFIVMLGTAEQLFANIVPTILFIASFILLAKCSIYIGKNEKWLLKENDGETPHCREYR